MQSRICIDIYGIVQGVGFRPHIYRLAKRLNLVGTISNTSNGVTIEIQGESKNTQKFLEVLKNQPPPLAQITAIKTRDVPVKTESIFQIVKSESIEQKNTLISPDITLCEDCLRELLSPSDRRYFYPFINCINCGPRFTIISDIPYDRQNTSMSPFEMCSLCRVEYDNPRDRRFHAQPNACPACGPQLEFRDNQGHRIEGDAIKNAVQALENGAILAIKGLGGFHLAVDANNHHAVCTLRERKNRFEKPLALMVANLSVAGKIAHINDLEEIQLMSLQRPIVLCHKKNNTKISSQVSLDNAYFGIMLPYTPLHEIILRSCRLKILVMTSANISEEPICYQNDECLLKLNGIADYYLMHNREIYLRCDDSVVRLFDDKPFFIRRARGYAPRPIILHKAGDSVLAVGGHLKNTICLTKDKYAFISQHIGDLENLQTLVAFEKSIEHLKRIFEISPCLIIHDLHPDYLSTQWVMENAKILFQGIQHHYAHILSVMAENGIEDDIIGIALDGTGFGSDGTVWGGEILICNINSFRRYGHFEMVAMPGGEMAIHQPWRMAVAYLYKHFGRDHEIIDRLFPEKLDQIRVINQMITRNLNAPLTSSCGRLFDAVAAILGLSDTVNYEGQAAIKLESIAESVDQSKDCGLAEFQLVKIKEEVVIDTKAFIQSLVDLKLAGTSDAVLCKVFHEALIKVFYAVTDKIRRENRLKRVALSGGCFQNMLLLKGLRDTLVINGFEVYTNSQVPVNDGGIALGQAYWGMHNFHKIKTGT